MKEHKMSEETFDQVKKIKGVLLEVESERYKQNNKWGEQNHCPSDWLTILMEEVGEASKAALETRFGVCNDAYMLYRKELIQVAAVAVAMIECIDRAKW